MSAVRLGAAGFAALLMLALAVPASADSPTQALRGHIDRVFAVLDDPTLKGPKRTVARHQALRALAEDVVDFHEAARRTLGATWNERTPAEREHFVRLFTDLIDHAYLARISRDGEQIAYDDELVNGSEAVVRARAIGKNGTMTPVVFALHRAAGDAKWRVCDVSFEGMSLIGNYRAQFTKIIRASSYEALVTRLEAKTATDAQASTATTETPAKLGAP